MRWVWLALLSCLVVAIAYAAATRASCAEHADAPTMIVVTPSNVTGQGIPETWALVRNARGLSYWAAPEVWHTLERK